MPIHYTSEDEDSRRWDGFPFRDGDIVVSTGSKHGTTWVQSILLSLIHGPDLPDRLATLSPWLDATFEPLDDVLTRLAAQSHRRVLKSHTPLDGLPLDPRAHWVVVARDPLDAAVSLWHQHGNLDRDRMRALSGTSDTQSSAPQRRPVGEWLQQWVTRQADPVTDMDSLDGVLHHYADAWGRRDTPVVVLVHFNDLLADLEGQVARLACETGMHVDKDRIGEVTTASTFAAMRARAKLLAPDPSNIMIDRSAFFRRGAPGAGRELLTDGQVAAYRDRVRAQVPDDLAAWLLRA